VRRFITYLNKPQGEIREIRSPIYNNPRHVTGDRKVLSVPPQARVSHHGPFSSESAMRFELEIVEFCIFIWNEEREMDGGHYGYFTVNNTYAEIPSGATMHGIAEGQMYPHHIEGERSRERALEKEIRKLQEKIYSMESLNVDENYNYLTRMGINEIQM
jgi:hypothetical protein